MPSEGYVVSLDCSTTATKAVVWDGQGRPVAEGRQTFDLSRPRPGWHEQDADQWRTSTMGAVATAVSQADADRVRAIGITHQRESFVCLDDPRQGALPPGDHGGRQLRAAPADRGRRRRARHPDRALLRHGRRLPQRAVGADGRRRHPQAVAPCQATETTALGAGILAAAAVGLNGTEDVRETTDAMTGVARTVEPTEQRARVYDGFYDVYRQLYTRPADLYPRLDAAVEHVADQEGVV